MEIDKMLKAKDAEIAKMRDSLEKYMIKSEAAREIAEQKGAVDLLLPHVLSRAKLVADGDDYTVRVFDEAGDARGDGKGGFMGVKELVAEMKLSPSFVLAFEASGTGARPGSDGKGALRNNAPATSIGKISAGLGARWGGSAKGSTSRSNERTTPKRLAKIRAGLDKRT